MTLSITGGCACGAIRYACRAAPVAMLSCHCLDCQRSSGAPFASGIVVAAADTEVTGSPRTYTVPGHSGGRTTRSFCGECGTPLFTRGEVVPDFMSIRYPTLDDASAFKPAVDIWTSRAQPWVCLAPDIPHFPESPE
ncbi:GFA family protein [Arenimonas sp. MALMAid1274]|uniref:GFA family protein n=1 Tax=Arenimonas sp. MALMAid1274 TaxID=3411630 RepID=UPI003BA29D13